MKNRYFSNAPRNHTLEGVEIKLCVLIVLFLYFSKSNFKLGGKARFLRGTAGKIELNVEKWSFSQGLSREFSRGVSEGSKIHNPSLFSCKIHDPQALIHKILIHSHKIQK